MDKKSLILADEKLDITKDIIKIVREVDSSVIHPYYEVEFDDIKEFVDGTKVQSQYYIELNPKDFSSYYYRGIAKDNLEDYQCN